MKKSALNTMLSLVVLGWFLGPTLHAQNTDISVVDFKITSFYNNAIPADSLFYNPDEPLGGPAVYLADTLELFTREVEFTLNYLPADSAAFVGLWLDQNSNEVFEEDERIYFGPAKEGSLANQLSFPDFEGVRRVLLAISTDEKTLTDPSQIPMNDRIPSLQFIIRSGPPALTMTSKKDTRNSSEVFCMEVPMEITLGPGHPCIVVDKWIVEYPVANSAQVNANVTLTSGSPFSVGTMLNANDYVPFNFDFSALPISDGDAVDFILQYADCSDPAMLDTVTFTFVKDCTTTNTREARPGPLDYHLEIAPNPVNGEMRVRYELPVAGTIELLLYDQQGRLQDQLQKADLPAGRHHLQYHPPALSPGLYLVLLRTPQGYERKKILILQ